MTEIEMSKDERARTIAPTVDPASVGGPPGAGSSAGADSRPGAGNSPGRGDRPSRETLLVAHAAARRRRNAAPLGSEAWVEAVAEIARIEVAIAELDRTADPPRL
ncbi:MAG: hypothetical protein K6U88_16150 [Dehalococcoidia bacterium]|nr:hypothetical protein [Dehalococcoidia bacterium]